MRVQMNVAMFDVYEDFYRKLSSYISNSATERDSHTYTYTARTHTHTRTQSFKYKRLVLTQPEKPKMISKERKKMRNLIFAEHCSGCNDFAFFLYFHGTHFLSEQNTAQFRESTSLIFFSLLPSFLWFYVPFSENGQQQQQLHLNRSQLKIVTTLNSRCL